MIFTISLMPVNWLLESVKWRFLLSDIEKISFFKSIKAVFSGITFSIFTPNRIGDLVGRIFVLKPENRVKAIFATGLSSFSQLIVTISIGILSFFILILYFSFPQITQNKLLVGYFIVFFLILTVLIFFFYFNIKSILKFLFRYKIFLKLKEQTSVLSDYSLDKLFVLLALSLIRYSVFVFQFYLLLIFFEVQISLINSILGISLMYLAMAVIPTFALTEIGVRGSTAIFFIGLFSTNISGILSASIFLWIINLAVPAIIGSFLFSKSKF